MRSNNETDFIIVFRGFDLCEDDTKINNLGIAPKWEEGVAPDSKTGSLQFGETFLRFHIHKYSNYTKGSGVIRESIGLWSNFGKIFMSTLKISNHPRERSCRSARSFSLDSTSLRIFSDFFIRWSIVKSLKNRNNSPFSHF